MALMLSAGSVLALLPMSSPMLLLVAVAFAWIAYCWQSQTCVEFVAFVTATVVMMMTLDHVPERSTAIHRMTATAIGGGIALAIAPVTNPPWFGQATRQQRPHLQEEQ